MIWARIGRSLLSNALYFAGCGAASCAVLGCTEGAGLGAIIVGASGAVGDSMGDAGGAALGAFIGAGLGGIVNTLAALPSFAIAGVLRGAHPFDLQRDELMRAVAAARRAALLCAVAGACTGMMGGALGGMMIAERTPSGCIVVVDIMDVFVGALYGVAAGNALGIWLGALWPGTVESAILRAEQAWRTLRRRWQ